MKHVSLQGCGNLAAVDLPLTDTQALALAELHEDQWPAVVERAADVRDRRWGRRLTYSPKVFLPVTNLCRNHCSYCSFRRSPGEPGAWTMSPAEVHEWLDRGRAQGCTEALLCLGDKPESAFGAYRRELASWGHEGTVSYLEAIGRDALARGLLPHTNAGVLDADDIARLRPLNVSMGLMLETASARLCGPGMPHRRAPDKRPEVRLRMIDDAGRLRVAFTTGILLGIGETFRERIEALLAIREASRRHGHVQEVIVQPFRAHPGTPMREATEPDDDDIARTIAVARLVLDADVTVQTPPNLNPGAIEKVVRAGINDFGGISPVTPDYINPAHAWPHVTRLGEACARLGFDLRQRLPVHDPWMTDQFVDAGLRSYVDDAASRLDERRVA
jgi:FO synthase